MPRIKKIEAEVKEKKTNKAAVKAKTKTKIKTVKTVKPVKSEKVKVVKKETPAKKTATVKAEINPTEAKPVKAPKPKKTRPTAVVGTINLKGKEAEILKKYQHNKSDTGSTEVQVALFTAKISTLAKHLKKHAKDSDSKRGLLIMVGKRRRLLNYLAKSNPVQYEKLIKDLGLRK